MTIKLSTTNSVNKTLQHKKALWDLETLCGDSRGYGGGEGVSDSSETLSVFFFVFVSPSFSLGASGSTGFWVTVMRSGTRGVANASNPSSSVNKLSIWRSAEARCHAGTRAGEGEGINKHRRSVQWSSSLVDEGKNLNMELRRVGEGEGGGGGGGTEVLLSVDDYLWILCAMIFSPQVSQMGKRNHSEPMSFLALSLLSSRVHQDKKPWIISRWKISLFPPQEQTGRRKKKKKGPNIIHLLPR